MRLIASPTGESSRRNEVRFLVDECVARPLVPALRKRFADVVYVADTLPAAKDRDVLAWAAREKRTLVTEDYDFGELAFRSRLEAEAIIIIAPGVLGFDLIQAAENVAERILLLGETLAGNLTIIERTRTRQRPL
jgi:predicted nuclease of predicted toxin-antitoxin system